MRTEKITSVLYWAVVAQVCVISISIAASSLLLGVIVLGLLALLLTGKRDLFRPTGIDLAVAAYVAVEFLTAFTSDHTGDALKNSKRLLLITIVYAVAVSFKDRASLRRALGALGISVALLSIAEIVIHFSTGTERLYVFQHYMTTGGLKMIVTLLLLPFILSPDTPRRDRIAAAVAFVPVLTALMLTNTRSAWLGLLFGILLMSVLRYRKLFAIAVAAVILFFQFAPQKQVERAASIVDMNHPSNVARFTMWSTGLRMWQDKPLLGFGDIDLYDSYLFYRTPTGDEPAGHLHNNYVHLLVTTGLIGLSVVLFLFYRILRMEYRIFADNDRDPFSRTIALGALAVFSGFLVNGLFEWNFGDHEIMVFVWFTVGITVSAGGLREGAAA